MNDRKQTIRWREKKKPHDLLELGRQGGGAPEPRQQPRDFYQPGAAVKAPSPTGFLGWTISVCVALGYGMGLGFALALATGGNIPGAVALISLLLP